MRNKQLGTSGIEIPEIGYGTWKYKGDPSTILRALELGSFLIDTAESYGTEEHVGKAISGNRDAYFIATKVSPSNFRHDDVIKAADASLKRLGIDTIDLYQLHWPADRVPIEETMGAMDELVIAGKVRYVGVSNFSVDLLRAAEDALGPGRVVENQIKYSLFDHEFADEVILYCQEQGITVLAYSPLEEGSFASELKRRSKLSETMARVCAETGKTRAQVLLNWVVSSPNVVTMPMTNRVERVDENCGASDWRLTAEQYEALAQAAGEAKTRRWWTS
jgi:diketogulonate reductase-like aldo/keto reductase